MSKVRVSRNWATELEKVRTEICTGFPDHFQILLDGARYPILIVRTPKEETIEAHLDREDTDPSTG